MTWALPSSRPPAGGRVAAATPPWTCPPPPVGLPPGALDAVAGTHRLMGQDAVVSVARLGGVRAKQLWVAAFGARRRLFPIDATARAFDIRSEGLRVRFMGLPPVAGVEAKGGGGGGGGGVGQAGHVGQRGGSPLFPPLPAGGRSGGGRVVGAAGGCSRRVGMAVGRVVVAADRRGRGAGVRRKTGGVCGWCTRHGRRDISIPHPRRV